MSSANRYGGLIWTNHALERLSQRGLPQDIAWQAYRYPDSVEKDTDKGSTVYKKQFGKSLVTIIVKQNEKKEWIVVSTWVNPPMIGTEDYRKKQQYKAYKKASLMGKIWHTIKRQILG